MPADLHLPDPIGTISGFILNDLPIREFASQGQHKTFLVALKIAEFHYIKAKLNETPAMLLDDVMTELDYSTGIEN